MIHLLSTRGVLFFAAILASPVASGIFAQDFLSGVVVDSQGAPVGGVNIDVLGLNGNPDPTILNDGTAIDGSFNVSVSPPGNYEVRFYPPPPPTTTHLILSLPSVLVSGNVVLGSVALAEGVKLSATILNPSGAPLPGVNLDVRLAATGQDLILQGDQTDALGNFSLAVPSEPFELRIDTTPVGTTIAPLGIDLYPLGDLSLGNIQLSPGFLVTAIVRNSSGVGVAGADYDARNSFTREKLYTPGDNTNATGFVDFVVPAGIYDFDVCPAPGVLLVSDLQTDIVIAGNFSFGVVTLQNGVLLSGTTFSHLGAATADVDVDVNVSGTGVQIPLCRDNSDASGSYQVVVPPGASYEVVFNPPFSVPLGLDIHDPVVISGSTVLNSSLPFQTFYTNTGSGTPGTGGFTPNLIALGGTPRLGNSNYRLAVTQARGGSKVLVSIGLGSCPVFSGWYSDFSTRRERFLVLQLSGSVGAPGVGSAELPIPLPSNAGFVGQSIYATARVSDPLAVGGMAWTPEFCTQVAP
jgi:hypothetical protein